MGQAAGSTAVRERTVAGATPSRKCDRADGFELCRQIRERSPVAIIVVSTRGGERDKVTALNMGADGYMTKPFGIKELLTRIISTLRRTRPASEAPLGAALTGTAAVPLLYSPPVTIWPPVDLTIQTIPGSCHSFNIFLRR
jgi:DNA-binding NtrC family response regulator